MKASGIRHFLDLTDVSSSELRGIIAAARAMKERRGGRAEKPLAGKTLAIHVYGNDHFDAKASPDNPLWQMVDIRLEEVFPREVTLEELRQAKSLAGMELLRKGSRLSVQPVKPKEFETVVKLGRSRGAGR